MDIDLTNTIISNLIKLDVNEYNSDVITYDYKYFYNTSIYIIKISQIMDVTISTLFSSLKIFRKLLRFNIPTDREPYKYIIFILTCIIISIKIDEDDIKINKRTIDNYLDILQQNKVAYIDILLENPIYIKDIEKYERYICTKLNYNLIVITPVSFVDHYMNHVNINIDQYKDDICYILLLIEKSILVNNYTSSFKSASAILYILWHISDSTILHTNLWDKTMEDITSYKFDDLKNFVKVINELLLENSV